MVGWSNFLENKEMGEVSQIGYQILCGKRHDVTVKKVAPGTGP